MKVCIQCTGNFQVYIPKIQHFCLVFVNKIKKNDHMQIIHLSLNIKFVNIKTVEVFIAEIHLLFQLNFLILVLILDYLNKIENLKIFHTINFILKQCYISLENLKEIL